MLSFIIILLLIPAVAIVAIAISPLWPLTTGNSYGRQSSRSKLLKYSLSAYVAAILVSGGLYLVAENALMDKEVWHYKITKINHEEEWTTKETRTRQVACGTDSKGHTKYRTETYHVTEHHGPFWNSFDERGTSHSISSVEYDKWVKIWANQHQAGVHQGSSAGFDSSITGRIFESDWTKDFDRIYPYNEIHRYENRIRHCSSVFKLKEPTKEQEAQYQRPAENENASSILSYGATVASGDFDLSNRVNAELGPKYLVHTILVLFGKDADRSKVDDVLNAWRGVNKNELVTFVCLDGKTVKWCEVHSWMDDTTIHADIRDAMMSGDFSTKKYADLLMKEVPKHWFKKNFHDFDYLQIEIAWGWKLGAFIFEVLIMIGLYFLIEALEQKSLDIAWKNALIVKIRTVSMDGKTDGKLPIKHGETKNEGHISSEKQNHA
jgi:hypothetical protein